MTQERLTRQQREQRASDELAEKLDALTQPLAERVLGRAIQLDHEAQAEAEAAADTIDYETLKEIALEVGISEEALKKALLEEFNTEEDHNARPVEKLTVPDSVRGGLIVPGDAELVRRRLQEYLQRVEGMRRLEEGGGRTVWASDRPGRVEVWTIPQARQNRHLVEVDVETKPQRKKAWRWIIAVLILGLLFGNAIGGLAFLALWFIGVSAVVGWVKRLARKARRSINRALSALTDDQRGDEPKDWLELWERTRNR